MRLFVAILLKDSVRAKLAKTQRGLGGHLDGVRWTKPDDLHLTIKFIGDVKDRDVPAVCLAVAKAASQTQRFDFRVEGCGSFPARGPIRVVWAGVKEDSGSLQHCVDTVENELDAIGYPKERKPFSAHITLGRLRIDRSDGEYRNTVQQRKLECAPQSVSSMVLMSSDLTSFGPSYTVASTAKFGVPIRS